MFDNSCATAKTNTLFDYYKKANKHVLT